MTSKQVSNLINKQNILKPSTIKIFILLSIIIILILIYLKINSKELYTTNIDNYFDKYFAKQSLYKTIQNKLDEEGQIITDLETDIQTVLSGKIISSKNTGSALDTITKQENTLPDIINLQGEDFFNGKIKNNNLNKCLDINNNKEVFFNTCVNNNPAQKWTLNYKNYQLQNTGNNTGNNKCLISDENGNLILNNCGALNTSYWTYNNNSNTLVNTFNNPISHYKYDKCLDKDGNNNAILNVCNGNTQQMTLY
jgi:hypothetical protein